MAAPTEVPVEWSGPAQRTPTRPSHSFLRTDAPSRRTLSRLREAPRFFRSFVRIFARVSLEALDGPSRVALAACSACGACDAQLRAEDPWDRGLVGPPSRWVRELAERPERWPSLASAIVELSETRARAMRARCHALVPFERLRSLAVADRPRPDPKQRKVVDPG